MLASQVAPESFAEPRQDLDMLPAASLASVHTWRILTSDMVQVVGAAVPPTAKIEASLLGAEWVSFCGNKLLVAIGDIGVYPHVASPGSTRLSRNVNKGSASGAR